MGVVDDVQIGFAHAVSMGEIENYLRLICFRKRVAVEAYPISRRQFSENVVVVEADGIVAGPRRFVLVTKARSVAFTGFIGICVEIVQTNCRHQQDVAVIWNAGATQMGMTKAVDDVIGVVITGTSIPPSQASIGA